MEKDFTTSQVAELFDVEPWRIRRLYELGVLTEPPKFCGRRVVSRCELPAIVDALRARGWLPVQRQTAEDMPVTAEPEACSA